MRLGHTKDSLKLVYFLQKHPNEWHGYANDKKTSKAMDRAVLLKQVEIDYVTRQMKYIGKL